MKKIAILLGIIILILMAYFSYSFFYMKSFLGKPTITCAKGEYIHQGPIWPNPNYCCPKDTICD